MPTTKKTKRSSDIGAYRETVESGARWANNIIVELLHNFGERITPLARTRLREANMALSFLREAMDHEADDPDGDEGAPDS